MCNKGENMALIGIRELRQKMSVILRSVQQNGEVYVITQQGRPIALLSPLDKEKIEAELLHSASQSIPDGWEVYARLANELRRKWPKDTSTKSLLDQIRQ
jgi:prevent-host-death family protein